MLHRIDERAPRKLARDTGQTARRQDCADGALRPSIGREIYRNEGSKARLHIGDKEIEPIEPKQAALGRAWPLIGLSLHTIRAGPARSSNGERGDRGARPAPKSAGAAKP